MSQRTKQQVKLQDSKTLTRHWDAFGRPVGYSVDGDRKQSITYDPATGRIAESDNFGVCARAGFRSWIWVDDGFFMGTFAKWIVDSSKL